jgi:MFS family permease
MKLNNLAIFTLANSIASFAGGLFGPFYVVYIQQIGGSIENLGVAFGLLLITQSIMSYFCGKYSDKLGRKLFLIGSGYITSAIVLAYSLVHTILELYVLQVIFGMMNAIDHTISIAFLGDVTQKKRRGTQIGKYNAIIGIFSAFAIIISGMLISKFGFKVIFYVVSSILFISTSLLFLSIERRVK